MNLSNETLAVLKNFATIQPNIVFRSGNELKTISEAKNIVAKATLTETITQDFGIYDVNDFLSSMSLFSNPNIAFTNDGKSASLSEGKSTLTYFFSDESSLTYPQKDVAMPATDVTFTLTSDTLKALPPTHFIIAPVIDPFLCSFLDFCQKYLVFPTSYILTD